MTGEWQNSINSLNENVALEIKFECLSFYSSESRNKNFIYVNVSKSTDIEVDLLNNNS